MKTVLFLPGATVIWYDSRRLYLRPRLDGTVDPRLPPFCNT